VPIEGDELADRIPALIELARELSVDVRFEELHGPDGSFRPGERAIAIGRSLSDNGKVATLCHELGHALLALDRSETDPVLDYAAEELVVESVAYSCCRSVGVETDCNSIPYLAGWAERSDLEVLERTADLIDRLAARIETALHADNSHDDDAKEAQDLDEVVA
jgi:antirestriction protein ArdC